MKKRILLLILTLSFVGLTACGFGMSNPQNSQSSPSTSSLMVSSLVESSFTESSSKEESYSAESSSLEESSEEISSEPETSSEESSEEDSSIVEEVTVEELIDFVVEVESGKDPVVLQLTDPQLCNWGSLETYSYAYIRESIEATNPDLIIVTGDIVYGKFDPTGSLLQSFISFMEGFQIPWAPVFGNHDNESLMGVDWQCAQLEAAQYCLFKQGEVTGNGNYSVGIKQNGEVIRVFYMMDSNGCSSPMVNNNGVATTPAPGTNLVKTSAGFAQDQIDWYTEEITAIHEIDADVKISFAYHVQQAIFQKAFEKYDEFDNTLVSGSSSALQNPLYIDNIAKYDTDFGFVGRKMKGAWDTNYAVFNGMKALGVDSIFVGHEHCNSASIVFEGVRFQYGQKSSTYDRFNWVEEDGTINGDYKEQMPSDAHALMGGTVIPISQTDGSIGTGYIYYAGDPFNFEPEEEKPFVPSITQGDDRRPMPTYDGEATSLGFPEGTDTVYTIVSKTWSETDNTGWDNRIIINADPNKSFIKFDVIFSANTSAALLWPGANSGTLGSYSLKGSLVSPSDQADENRQILIIDANGEAPSSFKANTLYTICVGVNEGELNVQFSAYVNATIYVANIEYYGEDAPSTDVVEVNGLQLTQSMLQTPSEMTLEALAFDAETAAYKVYTSGQYKIFFDTTVAAQSTTFTFTVFIPTDSAGASSFEFALRVKPTNNLEGSDDKYVYYTSSVLPRGQWKTFVVDISSVDETCTEFSLMLAAGTTMWIKDIAFTGGEVLPEPEPEPEPEPDEIVVNGIEPINPQSGISLSVVWFDGAGAYKATASSQGKIYIDTSLVANKSTLTFTVYVPEILSTNSTAFMLRVKPNNLTDNGQGYIYYTPSTVTAGTWQTFTVDISAYGDTCSEFSFVIPQGHTLYLKDITIS